jgi:hypothetical protein
MTLKVRKAEVWSATIEDRAGGAAAKLEPLSKAGANFEFVLTRRTPETPGSGVMYVTPVRGAKVVQAAQSVGLGVASTMHSLRIEGADKPGTTANVARALANAGISFRGLCAIAVGKRFVSFLALDSAEDAVKAAGVLRRLS